MGILTKRLEGRDEPILDPELRIVDAHHHLFDLPGNRYMLDDYLADISAGHKIGSSVYCETQTFARKDGPLALRPIGEVEFANGVAAMTAAGLYGDCKVAAAIIGHANLTLGANIAPLLDRCLTTAPERFRGVRHVTVEYPDDRPFKYVMTYKPPAGLLDTPGFPLGLAELERRGLTYDAAVFDPSLPKLTALIDQFPNLTVILNHMGIAIGLDMRPAEKAEVFRTWSASLRELAKRPHVFCKISGLGMPNWGFGFELREDVIGSEKLAQAWRPYVETAIQAFGPARCMFASNFPPDGRSCGFTPLWNAYKILTRSAGADERAALFHDTATRVYRPWLGG